MEVKVLLSLALDSGWDSGAVPMHGPSQADAIFIHVLRNKFLFFISHLVCGVLCSQPERIQTQADVTVSTGGGVPFN